MRSKPILVLAVLLVACSFAMAKDGPATPGHPEMNLDRTTRSNGTFGNFSVTGGQTGPLAVTVNVSATTAGNGSNTALNIVFLQGQVYNGLYSTYTWSDIGYVIFPNSTAQQSFSHAFSFNVPTPGDYAIWGRGWAGIYSGTTTGGVYYCPAGYICRSQSAQTCCYPVTTGDLFYVDNQQPPTATPDPNAGGQPIPTINGWGIAAMMLLLAGGAILLITRRS